MKVRTGPSEKARRDQALVTAAMQHGDQKAFAELMRIYKDTIFFMLLKMTGNHEDAEDLTIETFGKAFTNIAQYNPGFAFSTWLFRIATNHGIDFMRKRKKNVLDREQNELLDEPGERLQFVADLMNPEEAYIRNQKVENVRQVVETLKPRYRQLIALRYFEENTYEEIATLLELPLGTVKAQLFRAREFLYQALVNINERI